MAGRCQCEPGYVALNNECVKNKSDASAQVQPERNDDKNDRHDQSSHIAVAVVIPLMLIMLVAGSVFMLKRYDVVGWVRNKINQRQTPYDEVMIGQDDDDPPLSGV